MARGSWFGRHKRNGSAQKDVPDGLWIKCPSCGEILFAKDVDRNLKICIKCGYHHKLRAKERLDLLIDPDSFSEFNADLMSRDPLGFADYADKLTRARASTGLTDAILTGHARIEEKPLIIGVADFAFMGGSMGSVVGEKIVRAMEQGAHERLPVVMVTANGGGALGPIGLTIPATTPAGSYALEARVGGNKVASVNTTVAFRTLRLTVTPGTLVPGSSVTVRGSGFAPGEQVVLALNGSALLTNPTTVLADANGNISLSFVVPETVTNGSNAITASGASSRASVTQSVQASLPTATRLYFANGDTTGNTQTVLTMLNANDVPSTVKLTFLYQNQAETTYSQVIPAHSVANADLGLAAGPGRRISTILEADRQISAVSTTSFAGGDNETTPGANGPSRIWYLAEGYTNGSFREFLTVMNPGTTFATIDVRFLPFNDRPAREARFVMQPRSNIQIDAGLYVPGQSISAIVTADHSVVVERSMRFGANGRGAHDKIGISTASTVWAFAQGESGPSRQTFFTILNPSQAAPAAVTATFFDQAGKPVGSKTIIVNPLRRGNIKLNDVLPNAQVATILTSNVPVVVERPIYQSSADLGSAPSGSVIFGRNGGAGSWAFPSGSTANGDRTLLYLFNPGTKPVAVTATFYTATGGTLKQALTLAPNSDTVLDLSSVQGLPAGPIGTVLRSTDSQSFIAEETVLNATAQRASSTQGIAQ